MNQPTWNFEQEPYGEPADETAVNLRAYFDRMPDEKMSEYRRAWTDEQVLLWEENFRDDGTLFLICSERDVGVEEYRQVLEACIRYRDSVRESHALADRADAQLISEAPRTRYQ